MIIYGSIAEKEGVVENRGDGDEANAETRALMFKNQQDFLKKTIDQIYKRLSYQSVYLLFDRMEKVEAEFEDQ